MAEPWQSTDEHQSADGWQSTDDHQEKPKEKHWLDSAVDYGKELWAQINPVTAAQGIGNAVMHPIDTAHQVLQNQADLAGKSAESFKNGDYVSGMRHALNYVIPLLGPQIDEAGDKTANGKVAAGLGQATGIGLNLAAPELAAKAAPVVAKLAPKVQGAAERMYQSALKPPVTAGAEASRELSQTGLANALPVTEAGAAKLQGLIDDLNKKVAAKIQSKPGAAISPARVAARADETAQQFGNQVNPTRDLKTIENSQQEFLKTAGATPGSPAVAPQPTGVLNAQGNPVMTQGTPATPAVPAPPMAADKAQAIKQGTYAQLSKKYGELSSAQVESEKALARGIKEELETVFPEIKGLNAEESKLLNLQPALERAVSRVANHDLLGLGAPVTAGAGAVAAGAPGAAVGFLLKKVLDDPGMKSKLAITMMKASKTSASPLKLSTAMARVNAFAQALRVPQQQPAMNPSQ